VCNQSSHCQATSTFVSTPSPYFNLLTTQHRHSVRSLLISTQQSVYSPQYCPKSITHVAL